MSSVSLFPLTGTFDAFKAEFEKAANKRADHGLCDEKLTRLGQLDDSTAVVVFYDVKPAAWGPFIEDAEVAAFRATFKEPLTVYTSVRPASLPSTIAGVAHFSTTFDEFMGAFSKSQAKRLEYEVSDEARLQMIKLDDKTAVGFFYNFDFAAYARFHADPIVAAEYAVARDRVDLFYLQ